MKRIGTLLLAILILLPAVSLFSFAAESDSANIYYPNIHLRGNGHDIVDEDGNVVYDFDVSGDQIKAIAKRVLPLLLKNDLDAYYRAFGEEMEKLYDRALLDENGEPKYGTNIRQSLLEENRQKMKQDLADANGRYDLHAYTFHYDWRLDPLYTADNLEAYINGIMETTGADKVNINASCLGGAPLLAYLSKYGSAKLHAVSFLHNVSFGCELADETFSGKLNIDADAVARFEGDDFVARLLKENQVLKTFLDETVTLLQATGGLERISKLFTRGLYDKLYEGLAPELALSSFATWPSYWTMVTAQNYQYTKQFLFGDPGSERYTRYAGLIAKLDNYDAAVRQRIVPLLTDVKNSGTRLGIFAKYGLQMPPVLASADETGDVWVTVRYASLGATAAKVDGTLSDSYIAQRKSAGFGKYISPDHQIDASTCAFPDNTWFIKNAIHDDHIPNFNALYERFFVSAQDYDINTDPELPQFMVFDRDTTRVSPMTSENMHTESFPVNAEKPGFFARLSTFFTHLIPWFRALTALLKTLG